MSYDDTVPFDGTPWTPGWLMSKEEILKDIQEQLVDTGVAWVDNKKYLHLQCCGWEIVLNPDGTWFPNDTSGG